MNASGGFGLGHVVKAEAGRGGPGAAWPAQLWCSYLKMARWVCSCSSPLMTQEKSPKDSAPVDEGHWLEGEGPSSGRVWRGR